MMKFECHNCGKVLRAPDTAAGKVAPCPNCKARVKVPSPVDRPAARTTTDAPTPAKSLPDLAGNPVRQPVASPPPLPKGVVPPPAPSVKPPAVRGTADPVPPPVQRAPLLPVPIDASPANPETHVPTSPVADEMEFDDSYQWAVVAEDLNPLSLMEASRVNGDSSISVTVNCMPGRVRLALRYMTDRELQKALLQLAPWLLFGALAPVAVVVFTGLQCLACLLAFPVGWFAIPFVMAFGAWDLLVTLISFLYFLYQYSRGLYAYFTKEPYTYMPYGVAQLDPDNLVEFVAGGQLQVLRLDLSKRLLKQRVQTSKMGCMSIFLFPYFLAISILSALTNMALGAANKNFTEHVLFAFVVGEPVDLEKPQGFFDNFGKKRREKRAKENRDVFIVNTNPEKRDDISASIKRSLPGVNIQLVDDGLARQTLWRA